MPDPTAVSIAVLSTSYNVILQVLVRILSSVSNSIIFRFISKDALGVINVRLLLLYSTTHCLCREAFRRSCLSRFEKKSLQQRFNLLWMILPVFSLCSLFLGCVWLHVLDSPDPSKVGHYPSGVCAVLASVLIESLAEPIYVFSQSCHFVKLKVVMEGSMLTIRSVSMVVCLSAWPEQPMYCFCFSQLVSSIVYTMSFYVYFVYYLHYNKSKTPLLITSLSDVLPKFSKNFLDSRDVYLVWSFFKQTLLKQLLTEGERYLMTFFSLLSFAEQGLYDVINNLGSLAARFVFLPIEDSAYMLFTQLLTRDECAANQKNASMCLSVLENILKLLVLLGVTILVFGFSYSQLLLYIYGGTKLSAGLGLTLMRWHCAYVLLLALNGVSEGFKFAVMNHSQIERHNKNLVCLSAVFLSVSYILVRVCGSAGFIAANCVNMAFRIAHSFSFIQNYFSLPKNWCLRIVPHQAVLTALVIVAMATAASEVFVYGAGAVPCALHVSVGAASLLFLAWVVWRSESSLRRFVCEQKDKLS